MTTPVASTSVPVIAVLPEVAVGAEIAADPSTSGSVSLGPAIIIDSSSRAVVAGMGFVGTDDLALEIQLLQSRKTDAQAANEMHQAKSSKEAQIAAIQQRLEDLAKAAEEKASSEKSSFWSKVFKWAAAVVAAIAGALSAVFSAGAGAAVAAVVIAVVLASEQVVKAVTDALVECGAINEKQASIINACFGVIEDIINQLAEAGAFGEHGDKVAAVINLVVGAAKAIVSCVVGGVSSVTEIVGAVCNLTAEAVRMAQEVITLVYEAMDDEGQLSQEMMLALNLISLCLDIAGAACSIAEGAQDGGANEGNPRGSDAARRERIGQVITTVLQSTETGAKLGETSFGTASTMDMADAEEAESMAQREETRVERATARISTARRALEEVFDELNMVLDDVEHLMEGGDRIFESAIRL